MENVVKSLIGLVSICAAGACVGHTLPQKPAAEQVASGGSHDGGGKYGAHNMTADRFMVFWTMDYGYRLNPDGDLDTVIVPEFESEDTLREFNAFFSNENLSLNVGKRIYCDCIGERFERDGAIFYKIREARLFAK
jgi:hypothetical protein